MAGGDGEKETSDDFEGNCHEDSENMDKANDECSLTLKLKIHSNITTKILPQLHKCLTKKVWL